MENNRRWLREAIGQIEAHVLCVWQRVPAMPQTQQGSDKFDISSVAGSMLHEALHITKSGDVSEDR